MTFRKELTTLLNRYNAENSSNTPDFILAEYIENCLDAFDNASRKREKWYGHYHKPGGVVISID